MSSSTTDILAAIAQAQSFTTGSMKANQSQRWKLAWDQARADNRWIMDAADPGAAGPIADSGVPSARGSSEALTAVEGTLHSVSDAQPAQSGTRPAAASLEQMRSATVRARAVSQPGTAIAGTGLQALHIGGTKSAGPTVTPSLAATARPSTQQLAPPERSVTLLIKDGNVQVVIRDPKLRSGELPSLVSRVRQLVAAQGRQVGEIIVNGEIHWVDAEIGCPPAEPNDQRVIEVFL